MNKPKPLTKRMVFSVAAAIFLLHSYCQDTNPSSSSGPLNEGINPIRFQVGQKWAFRRFMINLGLQSPGFLRDTMTSYTNFECTKDTTIESMQYLILEATDYEPDWENMDTYRRRYAVHLSDSIVKVLEFRGDYGFFVTPFKLAREKKRHRTDLREYVAQKRMAKLNFDTLAFEDLTFPLVFPLIPGESWYYRQPNTKDHLPLRKTYEGRESVTVPAGSFHCFRIKWELQEMWQGAFDDMFMTDWISQSGVVKRYADFGEIEHTSETGESLGTFRSYDIAEYLGSHHVSPDTLLQPDPAWDSLKAHVDTHFSDSAYVEWRKWAKPRQAQAGIGGWELENEECRDSVYQELKEAKTAEYYRLVVTHNRFVHGWDDAKPPLEVLKEASIGVMDPVNGMDVFKINAIQVRVGADTLYGYSANQKKSLEILQ